MALFRVAAMAFICIQIQYLETSDLLQQMTCFHEALGIYGNIVEKNKSTTDHNFSAKCQDWCRIKHESGQGANWIVWFSNSSKEIDIKSSTSNSKFLVNCRFPGGTENICNTSDTESNTKTTWLTASTTINVSLPTSTETSASWMNNTSFTSQILEASPPGAFVGAVIGGAVLGAVITSIVFVVFLDKLPNWCKSYIYQIHRCNNMKTPVEKMTCTTTYTRTTYTNQRRAIEVITTTMQYWEQRMGADTEWCLLIGGSMTTTVR
ncbi:uncharacterized protein LOC111106603 isoform X2 [Crassostrea virginica]